LLQIEIYLFSEAAYPFRQHFVPAAIIEGLINSPSEL